MMKKNKTLQQMFSFIGFKAGMKLEGKYGDPKARIISLTRQKKRLNVLVAANELGLAMILKFVKHAIWTLQIIEYTYVMKDGVFTVLGAKVCV
jgi:hypothetical protein